MKGRGARVFIAAILFAALVVSSSWAADTQITIIYSNNISGQVEPSG